MILKDIRKLYFRFLKDHGVFKRVIYLHENGVPACPKERKIMQVLYDQQRFYDWLCDARTFCLWHQTDEGARFWHIMSCLWKLTCLDNGLINEPSSFFYDVKTIINHMKSEAASCLFARSYPSAWDTYKYGDLYNELEKLYKKVTKDDKNLCNFRYARHSGF